MHQNMQILLFEIETGNGSNKFFPSDLRMLDFRKFSTKPYHNMLKYLSSKTLRC